MKAKKFSEQLRLAIKAGPMSCYALSQATGVDEAALSRFVNGKRGLSLPTIDLLVAVLRARLVVDVPKAIKGGKIDG
jgi:transcriptional regulator with XRE-family HTH domain